MIRRFLQNALHTTAAVLVLGFAIGAQATPSNSATLSHPSSALEQQNSSQYADAIHSLLNQPIHSACAGTFFDWARAQNGWGYCYEFTCNGYVLNQGYPVDNSLCEAASPSHFAWGRAQNGYTYCYQWTPNGLAMNEGAPVPNDYCRY